MGHVLGKADQPGLPSDAGLSERLDPRLRIVLVVVYAVLVVSMETFTSLLLAAGFSLSLMVMARVPVGSTLKRMAAMDGFIIFMLLLLPFTVPGTVMFSVAGFDASWEGLYRALEIALKANAIILMVLSLLSTMETVTLGHALHRLRVPVILIHLMLFTVRYIQVLREEYQRMRQAMKARGFRPRNSWHTWKSFGYLVGMMLVRAVERSERILDAMKCRGFAGQFPILTRFQLTRLDAVFASVFSLCCSLLIVLEMGYGVPV